MLFFLKDYLEIRKKYRLFFSKRSLRVRKTNRMKALTISPEKLLEG